MRYLAFIIGCFVVGSTMAQDTPPLTEQVPTSITVEKDIKVEMKYQLKTLEVDLPEVFGGKVTFNYPGQQPAVVTQGMVNPVILSGPTEVCPDPVVTSTTTKSLPFIPYSTETTYVPYADRYSLHSTQRVVPATVRNYRPDWRINDGRTIDSHLNAVHGISYDRLNAMSVDAKWRLHDSIHNSEMRSRGGFKTPVRSGVFRGRGLFRR